MHPITTDLNAAQRAAADAWPSRRASACNQNCNQGRACDCVPAVEIEDGSPRHQRVPEGGAIAVLLVIAIAAICAAVHLSTR